jgi:hypothetical protein
MVSLLSFGGLVDAGGDGAGGVFDEALTALRVLGVGLPPEQHDAEPLLARRAVRGVAPVGVAAERAVPGEGRGPAAARRGEQLGGHAVPQAHHLNVAGDVAGLPRVDPVDVVVRGLPGQPWAGHQPSSQ